MEKTIKPTLKSSLNFEIEILDVIYKADLDEDFYSKLNEISEEVEKKINKKQKFSKKDYLNKYIKIAENLKDSDFKNEYELAIQTLVSEFLDGNPKPLYKGINILSRSLIPEEERKKEKITMSRGVPYLT